MLKPLLHRREFLRLSGIGISLPLLTDFSAKTTDRLSDAREQAKQFIADGVPSLSIAVIHRDRPVWVEAFGWADRDRRMPARATTSYAIASASKPFTGMAVAQLIADGRLSLDQPIGRYLNGITIRSRGGAPVTLRQTLQHRSGIPRHWRNFFVGQGEPPPFDSVASDYAFTTAAHGKRYLYSNMNYGLLAAEVAAISGQSFHDYLQQEVFRPLGLTTAESLEAHLRNWRAAIPYEEDGRPLPPYLVDEEGARDLVMSAFDLARFGLAHLGQRLGQVSRLMVEDRSTIGNNGNGSTSYGLGWIVEEDSPAALFSYGHTGEGPGAASSLTIVPAEELVVATIANQQGPAAYMLNEMIVDALSSQFAARRKAHPYQESPTDEEALRALSGKWEGELQTPAGVHPVSVTLTKGAASEISVGKQQSAVTLLAVRDGVLTGRAGVSVPAHDAQQWPHQARVTLQLSGEHLDGTLAAFASRGENPHDQFWLSYSLRLRRTKNP